MFVCLPDGGVPAYLLRAAARGGAGAGGLCRADAGGTALEEMEKQMIREALSRHNSKKQVADELGIGIATLYRKIKKYELLNT